MIAISNLSKTYGSQQVLYNINLTFEKGKAHGIAGENGAGKTTLFKCISGLESFTGDVKYEGAILKDHLGFLPTDPYFFSKITGREYLQLLCNARNLKTIHFDDKNIFDLPLDKYAETYSTGMKKKLALTAILIQNNDVYILDEPFNGVDIQSNIIIKEIILKLKSLNKIIIISSHIFSTLSDTCDELHLLREGKIFKSAGINDFSAIEVEMTRYAVGNKIEKLGLI